MELYLQRPICPSCLRALHRKKFTLISVDKYKFHCTYAGGLYRRRHFGNGAEWRFCDSRK